MGRILTSIGVGGNNWSCIWFSGQLELYLKFWTTQTPIMRPFKLSTARLEELDCDAHTYDENLCRIWTATICVSLSVDKIF